MRKRTTFRLVCVSKMTYVRRMPVADDGRLCSPLYVMYTVHVPFQNTYYIQIGRRYFTKNMDK